jgi:hypothetical protein
MPSRTGKKRPKSQAQARLMFAAAKGKVPGVSREVAKEYVRGGHGTRVSVLPKRSKKSRSAKRRSSR